MPLTPPPQPPSEADPDNFNEEAENWVAWVGDTHIPELDTLNASLDALAAQTALDRAASAASETAAAASAAAAEDAQVVVEGALADVLAAQADVTTKHAEVAADAAAADAARVAAEAARDEAEGIVGFDPFDPHTWPETQTFEKAVEVNLSGVAPASRLSDSFGGVALEAFGPGDDPTRFVAHGYGGAGTFIGARALGDAAEPEAVTANTPLMGANAFGYGSTGWSSAARAEINVVASENWTDSAQGTHIEFRATTPGTTTTAVHWTMDGYGRLIPGAGDAQDIGTTSNRIGEVNTRLVRIGGAAGVIVLQPRTGTGTEFHIHNPTGENIGIWNGSADILTVTTGGDLTIAGGMGLGSRTVATLPPAAANVGRIFQVTDALSPTWGAAPTGGGAQIVLVQSNGSGWIVT